ncbi:MAG: family 20 glycosylhydrolase [Acidobacteriia bacterium]|nr:family 20 glycosylhydrolase [Terriglobia bacterium]
MVRWWSIGLLFLLIAVGPATAGELRVIPHPREVQLANKDFIPDKATRIEISDLKDADDRFAAEQLAEEVQQASGFKPVIGSFKGKSRNVIALIRANVPNRPFHRLLQERRLDLDEKFDPEGYALDVDGSGVVAAANTAEGIFYAVQTLKQMIVRGEERGAHVQGAHIRDWPAMRYRGVHDDISRGPVPTLEFMKRQVRTAAEFKLNMWSVYLEYPFQYQSEPLIGPREGSLTAAEVKDLVEYARRYHVDVVPEQQAFGHLHHVLKWEKYSGIAELPYGNVLTPTNPKTYEFIQRLYAELVPLFPSKFFHIGADETFELGEGQTKALKEKEGLGKVYFDHIVKVRELMNPYHKRLMFWGDIALHYPELLKELPKDMVVMTWNYNPRDDFESLIKPFRDTGLDVMVCPGVNNWNRIFPNNNMALKNIRNFVRDGQRLGAIGMFNTTWDDDGEALFKMTWYGLVFGAAAAWQPGESSIEQFQANFDWAFYRNNDHAFASAIDNFAKIHEAIVKAGLGDANNTLVWANYLSADGAAALKKILPSARSIRLLAEDSLELLYKNAGQVHRNQDTLPDLIFAARRLDYLGMKILYAEQMSKTYWDGYLHLSERGRVNRNLRALDYVDGLVGDLRDTASSLRTSYQQLWLAENRPYWMDNVLVRYDLELDRWAKLQQKLAELQRHFSETSTLPAPDELGFFLR